MHCVQKKTQSAADIIHADIKRHHVQKKRQPIFVHSFNKLKRIVVTLTRKVVKMLQNY